MEKIDHIGIAVSDFAALKKIFGLLKIENHPPEIVDEQKVETLSFVTGESEIELLKPTANDSPVAKYLEKKNITYRWVPATNIAMDLGSAMSSNLVLLGFFSAFEDSPLNNKDLRTTIDSLSPERFKDINLKVFEAGFQTGMEKKAAS